VQEGFFQVVEGGQLLLAEGFELCSLEIYCVASQATEKPLPNV